MKYIQDVVNQIWTDFACRYESIDAIQDALRAFGELKRRIRQTDVYIFNDEKYVDIDWSIYRFNLYLRDYHARRRKEVEYRQKQYFTLLEARRLLNSMDDKLLAELLLERPNDRSIQTLQRQALHR